MRASRFTRMYHRPSITIDSNESANATICRPCLRMNGFLLAYSANGRAIVSRSSSVSRSFAASASETLSSSMSRNSISTYHSVRNRITIREKKSIHSSTLGGVDFGSLAFLRRRRPNPLLRGSSSSVFVTFDSTAIAASIVSPASPDSSDSPGGTNSASPTNRSGCVPSLMTVPSMMRGTLSSSAESMSSGGGVILCSARASAASGVSPAVGGLIRLDMMINLYCLDFPVI